MPPSPLLACLALLTLLATPLTMAQLECSEGQSRLDSGDFLECRQQHQARLHSMGIWIVRSTNPAWQAPAGGISACEYLQDLHNTCLPLYSNCTAGKVAIMKVWMRQAVADTEIYGAPAEIVGCPATTEVLVPTEVAEVADMLGQTYWRQESRYCSYLLHYHPRPLPLSLYNHNLDKLVRCDATCDPNNTLPQPFPLFQEEKAHINGRMNNSIMEYSQCLSAVGLIGPPLSLKTNITSATWHNGTEAKWSTCASFKTFVQNCTSSLRNCLRAESAEVVLAQDFSRMVKLVTDGLNSHVARSEVFGDFNHTHCDVFGGDVSRAEWLNADKNHTGLVLLVITLVVFYGSEYK